MGLRRAAFLSVIQAAVSMAASFASVKVTAVYLGPAGIGVLSQFQYFMMIVLGFAANSTNTATVRLTAEYAQAPARYRLYLGTVVRTLLAAGLMISVCVIIAAPWVAASVLQDAGWTPAVMLFGTVCLGGLAHSLLLATANGTKDFRSVTLINVSSTLFTVLLFVTLSPHFGLAGAMAAAALTPLVSGGMAFAWGRGRPWMPRSSTVGAFSGAELKRFLSFVPMTLVAALLPPSAQIFARDLLVAERGWADVGLVQGVVRLSDMYLNILVAMLSMYYLPRFAEIRVAADLRRELLQGLAIVVPAVAAISFGLYVGRDLLIGLIFTSEFSPMRDLFGWQMGGNVLRAASWLLGYLLAARAHPYRLLFLHAADSLLFVGIASELIPRNGGIGFVQATAVSTALMIVIEGSWVKIQISRLRQRATATEIVGAPSGVGESHVDKGHL